MGDIVPSCIYSKLSELLGDFWTIKSPPRKYEVYEECWNANMSVRVCALMCLELLYEERSKILIDKVKTNCLVIFP